MVSDPLAKGPLVQVSTAEDWRPLCSARIDAPAFGCKGRDMKGSNLVGIRNFMVDAFDVCRIVSLAASGSCSMRDSSGIIWHRHMLIMSIACSSPCRIMAEWLNENVAKTEAGQYTHSDPV